MRSLCTFIALALCLAGPAPAAEGSSLQPPHLVVDRGDDLNRLWIELITRDGQPERHLLRETALEPVPGVTGWDPAGQAAFAGWSEGGERWSAYGREGGTAWSEAYRLDLGLRLHAGTTGPGMDMPAVGADLALPEEGRLFLVQFRTRSLPEWRASLEGLGAEVLGTFPHHAHIVRLDPALLARVSSLEMVERVAPYHPAYRLDPVLQDWLAGPGGETQRVRVMALEWGPVAKSRIARAAETLGARIAAHWPSGHVLELLVDRGQLRQLAAHDDVMWIDRWSPPETDMDLVREDAGTNWVEDNHGYCGQGVHGEVMDSGIQADHPDFDGIMLHTAYSVASHGTSTFGIVFGNGDRDGDGQAQGTGHMPCDQAQGIFADADSVFDRYSHTEELKGSPYYASFQTNSWGNARTLAYNSYSQEIDDIIWRLDIAITQSQSNAGDQYSRPQAWAKNIISVGGVRHYNTLDTSDDAWSYGASIGPAADGRIKPDVNYWYDSIYTTTTGSTYTSGFGGTSAATPESAGVLGLMVQMWSDNIWGTDPVGGTVFERQPHASTIKALMVNNAQQYPFSGTAHDLTRVHQGWGRPSAHLAHERAAVSFIVDEETPLTLGVSATYELVVPEGESELKVTMVYPDPPGTTSSTLHRINDLNLEVTSPSSTVYHGNVGLDAATISSPGGSPNGVDTVENVFVISPEPGAWLIRVEAAEVNQDAYPATPEDDVAFALVVTGATQQPSVCGNGDREYDEDCDGTDLGGATCADRGCSGGGTLGCTGQCAFDTSQCLDCPVCGNGACEFGEDCEYCPGDCITGPGATCGNDVCETADGEDCISCSADCNGKQGGKPSLRYCCGDGDGTNPVGCSDTRCIIGGNTCLTQPAVPSCCGDGHCEDIEDHDNCAIDCGPPPYCGDLACDGDENQCNCPEDCGTPPASEVVNLTCDDGLDNDCDDVADCDDGDCAGDSACQCLPLGSPCASNGECCSNKCNPGQNVCK